MTLYLQLPGSLQGPLSVDKNAPPLIATTTITGHDSLESAVLAGEPDHLTVPRAWLQPHGGNAEVSGFAEYLERGGGRGDDGDGRPLGVGQCRQVR